AEAATVARGGWWLLLLLLLLLCAGALLAPLGHQPGGGQQALAGEGGALGAGELEGREAEDPALDDLARARGLLAREDGAAVQHGLDGQARPEAGRQVAHGGGVNLFLGGAERRDAAAIITVLPGLDLGLVGG